MIMLCFICLKADYEKIIITKYKMGKALQVECLMCPNCGDIVFTHEQSLELDKKRKELLKNET